MYDPNMPTTFDYRDDEQPATTPPDAPVVADDLNKAAAQAAQDLYAVGWLRTAPAKATARILASISRHVAATTQPSEPAVGGEAQRVLDEIVMTLESVADNDEAVRMLFNIINHHKSAAPLPVAGADESQRRATAIVGTVFDNTAASPETLKRTMIERVAAALRSGEGS